MLLLCFYLAAPLYDLPLLGISLSAFLLFLLFLEVERRLGGIRFKGLGRLPILLLVIIVEQFVSLLMAEYFDDQKPNMSVGLITLLRYAFWFTVCCLSARLFLLHDLRTRAVRYFAYGCQVVAVFVLAEYLLRGGLLSSGMSALTTLTQNSYGWQFSAFMPFVIHRAFFSTARARLWSVLGLLTTMLAVFVNASRSSWATTALGLALYLLILGIIARRKGKAMLGVLAIGGVLLFGAGAVVFLPEDIVMRVQNRPITAVALERDKSWQIRLLMIQKGTLLFMENPVFGIGPGQFRYTVADLIIPSVMRYESNVYFNQKSSHNSYVQLLAEGGLALAIPMGFLLLWLLVAGGKAVLLLARAGEVWAIPVWVSFVCFSIHYWAIAGITSTAPWFLYGFLGAVILHANRTTRARSR